MIVPLSSLKSVGLLKSDAVEVLIALERGRIVPSFPTPILPDAERWAVAMRFINVGRSPATIHGVWARFGETEEIFRETDTIVSPGTQLDLGDFVSPLSIEGQIFSGRIAYSDVLGGIWLNRFCVAIFRTPPDGKHFYHPAGDRTARSEEQAVEVA